MDRRQLIGAVLATLLVVVNVAVWFVLRQPSDRRSDTREILRDHLTSQWEDMPATSLDEVASELAQMFDSSDQLVESSNAVVYGNAVSFRTLVSAEKSDLIEAIGGAVSAIASGDPDTLVAYMADRGLEPDARSLSERLEQIGGDAHPAARSGPSKQLAALWELLSVDPHWGALVPEATSINVWKPWSMRHVSSTQLGRTESWLWGNDTVYHSLFRARPTFEQASLREPALLADVRVLIEFDARLKQERSPYFFRFWRSEKRAMWQPLVLKLVRTRSDAADSNPPILF